MTTQITPGRVNSEKKYITHDKALSFFYNSQDLIKPEEAVVESIEEILFDIFKNENHVVNVGKFLMSLESTGIRRNDPRLREMINTMQKILEERSSNISNLDSLNLELSDFKSVSLISKAFKEQLEIPQFQDFCKNIEELYQKCKLNYEGKIADYIPQLGEYKAEYWGVSICTVDGQRHSCGDVCQNFTLQSVSKPIVYSLALNELGETIVHNYVGKEPSGRMFNELILDFDRKPHNPMINSGAIMVCAIVQKLCKPEMNRSQKFEFTQNYFRKLAGGEYIGFNNSVFLSERDNADRNFALAYYMKENKCFPHNCNLMEIMDYYFQCCSLESNCESIAVIAATLANGGVCPITGETVAKPESVRDTLCLMHSCGMYAYSGQFAFKVGLPAKSGVSGVTLLVVPHIMGICLWSPPLDSLGNSELAKMFHLHRFESFHAPYHKLSLYHHKYESRGSNIITLLFSAASGDVSAMRRHLLSGMDMSQCDYDGRTAVHVAAAEGHINCVRFLVETCKISINIKDRWGHTALDDAKEFGHNDVVKYLQKYNHSNEAQQLENMTL